MLRWKGNLAKIIQIGAFLFVVAAVIAVQILNNQLSQNKKAVNQSQNFDTSTPKQITVNNGSWNLDSGNTATVEATINCKLPYSGIHPNVPKNVCDQYTDCQLGDKWVFYTSKDQCLKDQKNYVPSSNNTQSVSSQIKLEIQKLGQAQFDACGYDITGNTHPSPDPSKKYSIYTCAGATKTLADYVGAVYGSKNTNNGKKVFGSGYVQIYASSPGSNYYDGYDAAGNKVNLEKGSNGSLWGTDSNGNYIEFQQNTSGGLEVQTKNGPIFLTPDTTGGFSGQGY